MTQQDDAAAQAKALSIKAVCDRAMARVWAAIAELAAPHLPDLVRAPLADAWGVPWPTDGALDEIHAA